MDFERSARTLLRSAARCAETHPRSALVGRTGRAELRGRCSMTAGCCAQRHWAQSPSLFIHCGAERRAETYPRSTRSDRRGNGDALTSSLRFSRAREKRCTCRAGRRFLFAKFLFAKLRLGANAGGMDFERSARTLLRSAARCAETHPRSALVGRTGRAELRGRCSMTAGCCAQRHWAQSPSLFIHCGAERRAETYPRSTRSDRRGNGDALTSSLRFSRAREKRGTCRAGRRFLFAKFLFAKLRLGANAGGDGLRAIGANAAAVGGAVRRNPPAVGAGW